MGSPDLMADKLKVIYKPTASLVPYSQNARTHSDAQINQVVASIKEFGWTNPVLIDDNGGIVAGHARVQAANRLGLGDIPCILISGLSEAQKRAYIIADNQLAMNAGWDTPILSAELIDLKDLDFDINLLGFNEKELADLLNPQPGPGLTDPNEVPDPPKLPVTVPGDLWILGAHRLICGDSTNPQHVELVLGGGVSCFNGNRPALWSGV
jgi:hypothetical protein